MALVWDNEHMAAPDTLRHVIVVGGRLADWAQWSASDWQQRLEQLGKVADSVGAQWVARLNRNTTQAFAEPFEHPATVLALSDGDFVGERGMTRGVAPLILGYQAFDRGVRFAGVILNRLGGARHEAERLAAATGAWAELAEAFAVLSHRLTGLALDGEPSWRTPLGIQGPTCLPIRFDAGRPVAQRSR